MTIQRVRCPRIESPCEQGPAFAHGQKSAFCAMCSKDVYNLSALDTGERRALFERESAPCVRYRMLVPAVLALAAVSAQAHDAPANEQVPDEFDFVVVGGAMTSIADEVFLVSEVDEPWLDAESSTVEDQP